MLKSRGRDGMTGTGRNSARWSDASKGGNDLGRLDCHQRLLGGETRRSACEGRTTVLLRARQVDCRRIPTSLDTTLMAQTDARDTLDFELSRLRYQGQLPRPAALLNRKARQSACLHTFPQPAHMVDCRCR